MRESGFAKQNCGRHPVEVDDVYTIAKTDSACGKLFQGVINLIGLLMALVITAEETIDPNQEVIIRGQSPKSGLSCIFEDDRTTGYL